MRGFLAVQRLLALTAVAALVALAAVPACENGTTSAPIPVYEGGTVEAGNAFSGYGGTDAGDAARDAPADVRDGATMDGTTADATMSPDATTTPDATTIPDATPDSSATDAADSAPVCMDVGTANEGWYTAVGVLLCKVSCAGLTAKCERVGTGAQGWYTTSGHGCPPHSTEILNDPSCS